MIKYAVTRGIRTILPWVVGILSTVALLGLTNLNTIRLFRQETGKVYELTLREVL